MDILKTNPRQFPNKPLVIITANTSWNIYSRRKLIQAIQNEGFETICMGATGSMTGVKKSGKEEKDRDTGDAGKEDKYSRLIQQNLKSTFISLPMEGDGTNPIKDLRLLLCFIKIYKKLKPVAALHFNNKPDIYGSMAASLCSIPSFNNITGLGVVAEKKGLTAKIVYTMYKAAFFPKKAFVFFQNKNDRDFFILKSLCNPGKTEVIPGSGVDIDFFRPDYEGGNNNISAVPNTENGVRFLFSGRLLTTKGCGDFIEAAAAVKTEYPTACFDLIGEHDSSNPIYIPEKQLEEAVKNGTVTWHGLTEDVRPYIKQADCVVLPSYYREGVPRVLLEAAAMGKALIAADSPGTKEPVEEGINGYLCQPADPENLEEKMKKYISLPIIEKKRMGEASRNIAETRFADTIVAEAYIKRLRPLL